MLRQSSLNTDLWKDKTAKDVGTGFSSVDVSEYFDTPKVTKKLVSKVDASSFIKNSSKNKFIKFFLKPRKSSSLELLEYKKTDKKKDSDVTVYISDKQKRNFSKSTKHNIESIKEFYLTSILPYSVGVNTAFLETNEIVVQLLDEKVELPSSYFKTRLQEAVQVKTLLFIKKYLSLTDEETNLFISSVSVSNQPKDTQWALTNLENTLKTYLKKT